MMKKLFFPLLLIASVVMFSCEKNSDANTEKAIAQSSSKNLTSCVEDLDNEEGMKAMEQVLAMDLPFTMTKKSMFTTEMLSKLTDPTTVAKVKKGMEKKVEIGDFVFNGHTGTYTWNKSTETWDYDASSPSDAILVYFPTQGSRTNDAMMRIHSYTSEVVDVIFYGELEVATGFELDIYVDDALAYHYVYSATLGDNPLSVIEALNIQITVGDYRLEYVYTNEDGDQVLTATLTQGTEQQLYINNSILEYGTEVYVEIQYDAIRIVGNVDMLELMSVLASENATEEDLLGAIDYKFYTYPEEEEIGILVYEKRSSTEWEAMIEFSDGSRMKLATYFAELQLTLEKLFGEDYSFSFGLS